MNLPGQHSIRVLHKLTKSRTTQLITKVNSFKQAETPRYAISCSSSTPTMTSPFSDLIHQTLSNPTHGASNISDKLFIDARNVARRITWGTQIGRAKCFVLNTRDLKWCVTYFLRCESQYFDVAPIWSCLGFPWYMFCKFQFSTFTT